jgi:hypothetical protein
MRTQSQEVAVLDKAFALWPEVIFGEVRKRPLVESKWDSFTLDILLAYASHDLGDVDVISFGSCLHHVA